MVTETVAAIAGDEVEGFSQELMFTPGVELRKAPKIRHEDCEINWNDHVSGIFNLIRGLSPHPGAFTTLTSADGTPHYLKVYRAYPEYQAHSIPPGHVLTDGKSYLKIAVQDGFIQLSEIQPAGRKTLSVADFLRGLRSHFS